MNLKEAQLLGILALIAVGIILLCMWGGGELEEPVASSDAAVEAGLSVEPSIAEICDMLLSEEEEPAEGSPLVEQEAEIQIGEDPAGVASFGEDEAIQDFMDTHVPEDIPLTPPEQIVEAPPPAPAPAAPVIYVVQKGDTLSSISKRYYGTSTKWQIIHRANREVVPDPALLRPGTRLTIPPVSEFGGRQVAASGSGRPALSATASATPPAGRTYTVKKGDVLFRIALRCYGDGARWKDILAANSARLKDPRDLRPGMKLTIP